MSKVLDWSKTATPSFFEQRETYRGRVQEQIKKAKVMAEEQALIKAQEPSLRKALLNCMLTKAPITIMRAFQNPTETLGGLVQKSDDDDGFYHNSGSGDDAQRTANAKFEEVMETIPTGEEIVFKCMEKTLQQWIFLGKSGREYAIYFNPDILFKGNWIKNPGLFGLLYNTDVNRKMEVLGE